MKSSSWQTSLTNARPATKVCRAAIGRDSAKKTGAGVGRLLFVLVSYQLAYSRRGQQDIANNGLLLLVLCVIEHTTLLSLSMIVVIYELNDVLFS